MTSRRLLAALIVAVALVVAACSSLPLLQRLDALAKAAKYKCDSAAATQKAQQCHLALACAEPVSVAQHKVLASEEKLKALEPADNERAVAAVAVVAAEAACRKAGVVAGAGLSESAAAKQRLDAVAAVSSSHADAADGGVGPADAGRKSDAAEAK